MYGNRGSGNGNGGNRSSSPDPEGAFCLKWNNHKSVLFEVIESLVKMECYVDCTIFVDNHVQFKAHRVVLAACSQYFELILQDAPQENCSILFPGVEEFEMKTLLEYIYSGQVEIAQSDIPRLMRIAKMLEIKGLLETIESMERRGRDRRETAYHPLSHSSPIVTTSTKISSAQSSSSPPYSQSAQFISQLYQNSNHSRDLLSNAACRQESSDERNRNQWSNLPLPLSRNAQQSMLSSVYESGSDMNPLKRKKLSSITSMLRGEDTPILRNVLAQTNAADSSQSTSTNAIANSSSRGGNGAIIAGRLLNDNYDTNDTNNNESNNGSSSRTISGGNNGSVYVGYARKSSDRSYHSSNGSDNSDKKFKEDEPASPLTDRSFDDEPNNDRRTSPPEFLADMRIPPYLQQHPGLQQVQFHPQNHANHANQSGGSGQKPEWKRYKQYTRNDIMAAIQCVRDGMSALQASRKFGVPSRTLYDKVKKLGITTGTPRNRSSSKREAREVPGPSSSIAAFPYGSLSGPGSGFKVYPNQDSQLSQSQDFESDEPKHQRPYPKSLFEEFQTGIHAMAIAAAAHAQMNGGLNPQPGHHDNTNMLANYINRNFENDLLHERERNSSNGSSTVIKKEPAATESDDDNETVDKAENLSMSKHEKSPSITPPPPFPHEISRSVIVQPQIIYASPRSEPSSTTPPSNDQPIISELSPNKTFSESPPIPTTTASYDE